VLNYINMNEEITRQPRRLLDRRKVNVVFDANAFDQQPDQVKRLLALKAANKIGLIAPGGVRKEIQHPNTPAVVREIVLEQIYSLPVEPNDAERRQFTRIHAILQGNAAPGKHAADARHVFEAAKYGGDYFITHDRRINQTKRRELQVVLPPSLRIVTLIEFLAIYDLDEATPPA